MRRSRGSRAEVAGRGDQATAQQVPPHPVDPDSSRERIVLAGNGPGQLVTTAAIDKRIGVRPSQQRQEPPGHLFARLFGLAATENTRRGGLVGIVEDPGDWWGGGIVGPVLDRLLGVVMLRPGIAVKQVFDIARRAIVERRARAADELADFIFGLVVQLGGAFSIRRDRLPRSVSPTSGRSSRTTSQSAWPLPPGRREACPRKAGPPWG